MMSTNQETRSLSATVLHQLEQTAPQFNETSLPSVISPDITDEIISAYVRWDNEANDSKYERSEHKITTSLFYSPSLLPCLVSIHEWGNTTSDETAQLLSSNALRDLKNALTYFYSLRQKEEPLNLTFARLTNDDISGDNDQLYAVKVLFREARRSAIRCIARYADQDISLDKNINVPREEFRGNFKAVAKDALKEYLESQEGISLPRIFSTEIESADILCLSIDYNSIFNEEESFANPLVRALVEQRIKILRYVFQKKYPGNKLRIIINSGRPGPYVWSAAENITPLDNLREVCLAENGGLKINPTTGEQQLSVEFENPHASPAIFHSFLEDLWKVIKHYSPDERIKREKKESMLSFQIADPASKGGKLFMEIRDFDNVKSIFKDWCYLTSVNLDTDIDVFIKDIQATPGMSEEIMRYTQLDEEKSSQDGLYFSQQVATQLKRQEFTRCRDGQKLSQASYNMYEEFIDLLLQKETLAEVMKNIEISFNDTVGFIDIAHRNQNKFTGLFGLFPPGNKVVYIHIGDSTSDIPVLTNIPDKWQKNIEKLFLIGPDNSSSKFRKATDSKGERGYIAARSSILGLYDILLGIIKSLSV